jgi:hypothetical protein
MTPSRARSLPALFTCLLSLLMAAAASAQSTQPAQTPPPVQPAADEPKSMIDRLKEPDQAGGLHLTEHFAIAFGGIKQGSGIALGPALSTKFEDGGFIQLKAVASIRKFWVLQLRYDTRRFWNDRAIAVSRLRYYDAPELSLYYLGPDSPDARVHYSERKLEASTVLQLRPTPAGRFSAGFGYEGFKVGADPLPVVIVDDQPTVPLPLPGVDIRPRFAHVFGSAGYDTRLSPDYSRGGRFAEIELHHYLDTKDGLASFRRVDTSLEQLIPTHGSRGVIGVGLQTFFTFDSGDGTVPFYMMPTLGGGNLLRAFPSYRFRDRDAMLFKGEYRWAVHKMLDVAGIYEAGMVAPRVESLSLSDVEHSYAIGLRAHTEKAALFRFDIAHGREGWGMRVGFTGGGS